MSPINLKKESINYIEFPASDLSAVKEFYQQAFAWQFIDYGEEYTAFNDGTINGGFYKANVNTCYEKGGALIVLYSQNLEQSVAKVINKGGKIVKPIFAFPGGRRFHFTDPCGNELAIWSDK